MSIRDQFAKLTDNWLLILIFVLGIFLMFFGTSLSSVSMGSYDSIESKGIASTQYYEGGYYGGGSRNPLMPNVLERIIVKTASLSISTKEYAQTESQVRSFILDNNAIITNENSNTYYGKYKTGYFSISVPTEKYETLANQLKQIGNIESFTENANDITGSYLTLQDIIASEKSKLNGYELLFNSSASISEKKSLLDSMYEVQNNIRSYEKQLETKKDTVGYSQISLTIQEERPKHANVVFATFSDLWSSFKASLNTMMYIIAYVLPFAIAALIIWAIVALIRRLF